MTWKVDLLARLFGDTRKGGPQLPRLERWYDGPCRLCGGDFTFTGEPPEPTLINRHTVDCMFYEVPPPPLSDDELMSFETNGILPYGGNLEPLQFINQYDGRRQWSKEYDLNNLTPETARDLAMTLTAWADQQELMFAEVVDGMKSVSLEVDGCTFVEPERASILSFSEWLGSLPTDKRLRMADILAPIHWAGIGDDVVGLYDQAAAEALGFDEEESVEIDDAMRRWSRG